MTKNEHLDMRKSFLLRGAGASAARAVHVMMASLEQAILAEKAQEPVSFALLGKAFEIYGGRIKDRFNLQADTILSTLGLMSPVKQIFAYEGDNKTQFYAYEARPNLLATTQDGYYVLDVAVGYDGAHFTPLAKHARPILPKEYMSGGMGNYSLKGIGGVILPPILSLHLQPCEMPENFDARVHSWAKSMQAVQHPYIKVMRPN